MERGTWKVDWGGGGVFFKMTLCVKQQPQFLINFKWFILFN